jgi:hypothetical protein
VNSQKNKFFFLMACTAGIFSGCVTAPKYVIVDEKLAPIENALVKDGFLPVLTQEWGMSEAFGVEKSMVETSARFGTLWVDLPAGVNVLYKKNLLSSGDIKRISQGVALSNSVNSSRSGLTGGNSFSMQKMNSGAWGGAKDNLTDLAKDKVYGSLNNAKENLKTIGDGSTEFDVFYNACVAEKGDFKAGAIEKDCFKIKGRDAKTCSTEGYRLTCGIKNDTYVIEMRAKSITHDNIYYVAGFGIDQKNSVINSAAAIKETLTASEGKSLESFNYFVFYKK